MIQSNVFLKQADTVVSDTVVSDSARNLRDMLGYIDPKAGVDGAKETIPGTGGYYRPKTLEWVDKQLTKYKKKKVVIIQHFPILPPTESKTHRVYQVETYFDVLKKHDNVIAILSGHYHTNKEKMDNGIYHINSPSLMAVTNPYKIIDIVTTKGFSPMIYTQIREVECH